jgi:hypothetical protein
VQSRRGVKEKEEIAWRVLGFLFEGLAVLTGFFKGFEFEDSTR